MLQGRENHFELLGIFELLDIQLRGINHIEIIENIEGKLLYHRIKRNFEITNIELTRFHCNL